MSSPLNFEQRNRIASQLASFQLVSSLAWAYYLLRPEKQLLQLGVFAAVPLITFGSMMLLGTYVKGLIPSETSLSVPRITFPILWAMATVLIVEISKVQESATTALPEALQKLILWSDPRLVVPIFIFQFLGLSLFSSLHKRKNQSSKE